MSTPARPTRRAATPSRVAKKQTRWPLHTRLRFVAFYAFVSNVALLVGNLALGPSTPGTEAFVSRLSVGTVVFGLATLLVAEVVLRRGTQDD